MDTRKYLRDARDEEEMKKERAQRVHKGDIDRRMFFMCLA